MPIIDEWMPIDRLTEMRCRNHYKILSENSITKPTGIKHRQARRGRVIFFVTLNPLEVAALSGLLRVVTRVTHSCILVPDSWHSMSL